MSRIQHENILFNPTDKDVLVVYNSIEMPVESGEEVEVPETKMFRWILKNYKYKGLVDLTYGENMKKVHKTYEDFKRAKTLDGLKAIHEHAKLTLAREQQAVNNSAGNGGSALDKLGFKVKTFEKRVEEIAEKMADIVEAANDTVKKAKKGKKDESLADQNESEAQA